MVFRIDPVNPEKILLILAIPSREQTAEEILDLFARVNLLMLQPVAGDVLSEAGHSLRQKLRIGLSDLTVRHSLFQQRLQDRSALVTCPDRERPYRGIDVTGVVIVKETPFVLLDEVKIGVQYAVETLQSGPGCLSGGLYAALEQPGVLDHEIDEHVIFALEVEVERTDRKPGPLDDLFDPERRKPLLVNQTVGRLQYSLPHLRIRRPQAAPLPPGRSYRFDLLQIGFSLISI
jgi:hypothetical protein